MIRVHCDAPDCEENRAPSSRPDGKPGPVPRWLSLKRGDTLFDFCTSTCLTKWAAAQGAPADPGGERRGPRAD